MNTSIIGKTIDTYEITGVLGKGGMGIVYKAKDTTLDRDVALKMMDANFARDEEFLKRFKAEAKALARLQNPNIVSVFALRETELGFCLVMEFVEGNTVADRIRSNGPMPTARAVPIFRQLLTALGHAHDVGVIHRDIKPSNVMLTPADHVKLTDFGLAKIQRTTTATMTMGTGGTLYYMSPEQVKGLANVDARGDIYSLGMTLYETVTGRVPFGNNASDFDIRQMIVDGKIAPPEKFLPTLPSELCQVIAKSIHKDPAKRFQSCSEFNDALSLVPLASGGVGANPVVVAGPIPKPARRKNSRRPLYLTLGIGIALIGLLVAYQKFSSEPESTILVRAQPRDASISVNGLRVRSSENVAVKPGRTTVRVQHEGFRNRDTVLNVADGESATLVIVLEKLESTKTNDQPAGATSVENTAAMFSRSASSEKKSGASDEIALTSTLQLRVLPSGSVSVDGGANSKSSDNYVAVNVRPGKRRVVFENPKYGSKEFQINILPNETKKLTCYFEAEANVAVSGGALWAYVVLDGKVTDLQAPRTFTLAPGRHRVSVSKMGFDVVEGEQVVNVEPGLEPREVRLAFTLQKK